MKYAIAVCICFVATPVWSQAPPAKVDKSIVNPFHYTIEQDDDMGMGMGDMGMDDMMGMGMDVDMGPTEDELFRANLPLAIEQLKQSKTPEQRATYQLYIREAFEQRYDRMMAERKQDIERLRKSLNELESDLTRRSAAKDRVVKLQLQSVQLAAEGLLEMNDLQGVQSQQESSGGGMGGGFGAGMGGGGGAF